MIKTERLHIYPASREQMKAMIASEQDEELKKAFSEMLEGCLPLGIWAHGSKIAGSGNGRRKRSVSEGSRKMRLSSQRNLRRGRASL